MASGSHTIRQNFCVNFLANILGEQDELADAKSDAGSYKILTFPEVFTLPLVPPPVKDLFIKFMKVFIETTQA